MPLAELVRAIEQEAAVEIAALREAAARDVAQIDAETARACSERTASATQAYAGERQVVADALIADAERTARARVLARRAAMLERVHAALTVRLPALLDAELGRVLIADAVACAGASPGVARCAPAIVEAARAAAPPWLAVEPDPAVATGIEIELATGTRIVATLAALGERTWPRLATAALEAVP